MDQEYDRFLAEIWAMQPENWDSIQPVFKKKLGARTADTVAGFWRVHANRSSLLFTSTMANGGYMLMGGDMGSDGFSEFTDKIASLPLVDFEKIRAQPDCMVEYPLLEGITNEMFEDIFVEVYDDKMGAEAGSRLIDETREASNIDDPDWEALDDVDLEDQEGLERIRAKYEAGLEEDDDS